MAECYIFYKDNTLTQEEIDALDPKELKDYETKIKAFDIFQVFEDGYFDGVTAINNAFAVIKFPTVPVSDVLPYIVPDEETTEDNTDTLKIRRWQIQDNKLSQSTLDDLELNRIATETDTKIIEDFSTIMKDKKL